MRVVKKIALFLFLFLIVFAEVELLPSVLLPQAAKQVTTNTKARTKANTFFIDIFIMIAS